MQGGRAGVGHIRWYFRNCNGKFVAARSLPARKMYKTLQFFEGPFIAVGSIREANFKCRPWHILKQGGGGNKQGVFHGMAPLASERSVESWTVKAGLISVRTSTVCIIYFLGNVHKYAMLIEKYQHIPFLQQFDNLRVVSTALLCARFWRLMQLLEHSR